MTDLRMKNKEKMKASRVNDSWDSENGDIMTDSGNFQLMLGSRDGFAIGSDGRFEVRGTIMKDNMMLGHHTSCSKARLQMQDSECSAEDADRDSRRSGCDAERGAKLRSCDAEWSPDNQKDFLPSGCTIDSLNVQFPVTSALEPEPEFGRGMTDAIADDIAAVAAISVATSHHAAAECQLAAPNLFGALKMI